MASLPLELLDSVCAYLQPTDLRAVAILNSAFYHVAQRLLYRHIALDAFSPVVFTLARNPVLARHVRSFAIRLNPFAGLLKSFYTLLATAIANMSELTSLEVFADHAATWIMRNDQSYSRLQRFASSFHMDENVSHFLNKSDALTELEIDSLPQVSATPHLRSDALPILSQFTGSSQAAQVVVPGRPVEHIHLNSGDLTEEVAVNLAKSTLPVLVLGAATSSHSVSLIGTLTHCMDRLVHLRIVTTYNFSDAPDTSYFTNIADALTSLPDLQSCEIWGLHWISSKKSFHDASWQSEPAFNANNLLDIYSDLYFPY